MKKAAIINSINQANDIKDLVSAFIMPLEKLSINYDQTFTIKQIQEIKRLNKEIFVSINKNIHNNELTELEKTLLEIEKLKIEGIIFYDISIINLKQKLNLKTPLVWAQEHLSNNYETINYYYQKGANYAFLSSEITKEEMENIKKNTKAKLFVLVFGHIPMFTSRRHLVKNYQNYFNLEKINKKTKIHKEGKYYPIEDKENGTTVYSDYVLNALDQDFSNFDYIVYNSYLINDQDFKETLKGNNKFPFNHGFLYQETIFRVKKDE